MTRPRYAPNPTADRRRDEAILIALQCWDEGYSAGQIARIPEVVDLAGKDITRNVVIGWIGRVHAADPGALTRRPERNQ